MPELVTRESDWASWPGLTTLPALPEPSGRVVVVSAHPDDEVLGAGALIASLANAGADVTFVCASDGEASHPQAAPLHRAALPGLRTAELGQALRALGLADPDIHLLHLPDSEIADHAGELQAALRPLVTSAHWVLSPASFDGHPDHAAVGDAAAIVCRGRVPVLQLPIWMWHWRAPDDTSIPWEQARRFELSVSEQRQKEAALACFRTQVAPWPEPDSGAPILPPDVLDHFVRGYEVFFT